MHLYNEIGVVFHLRQLQPLQEGKRIQTIIKIITNIFFNNAFILLIRLKLLNLVAFNIAIFLNYAYVWLSVARFYTRRFPGGRYNFYNFLFPNLQHPNSENTPYLRLHRLPLTA